MSYIRFFKSITDEIIRDFSALGNPLLLILILALVVQGQALLFAIFGLALCQIIGHAIKLAFFKNRPKKMKYENILEKARSGSFPSIHSAQIMFFGLVMIQSIASIFLDILYGLVILFVGYSRTHLKKHFIVDVVCGYALGLAIYLVLF